MTLNAIELDESRIFPCHQALCLREQVLSGQQDDHQNASEFVDEGHGWLPLIPNGRWKQAFRDFKYHKAIIKS